MFKSRIAVTAIAITVYATHNDASAQVETPTYDGFVTFMSWKCPDMVRGALGNPVVAPLFLDRPADIIKVCACTTKAFQEDQRLRQYMNVDQKLQAIRGKTQQFQTYANVRLYQSMLVCIEPELKSALSRAPLSE